MSTIDRSRILVGTCSWTDQALVASGWYPPGARSPEGRLRHYAARFPVVEADTTYYGLPAPHIGHQWAQRTPAGFTFDVKAFAPLTGHPVRAAMLPADLRPPGPVERRLTSAELPRELIGELWRRFAEGVRPLREAGRLGAVLVQFPPWLAPGPRGRARVAACRAYAGDLPLAVEFRHPGWFGHTELPGTLGLVRECGMALVAVDTSPRVPAAVPPVAEVTCPDLAVVRFHGRSAAWGRGSKEERFRHDYTSAELAPWAARVRRLARGAARVHVLFNNCCGRAAVTAAETMRTLLAATAATAAPSLPARNGAASLRQQGVERGGEGAQRRAGGRVRP
ncbi:DUF72 domain-containing protein [Streptomyces sp. NPDC049555]|uniref:DUF72 domain-containing protein n=1 Tax=Streptomyces sp. NPDC049555 TaxID=3154930 RepID=UPI00342F5BB0